MQPGILEFNAPGRWRREDPKFEAILGYTVSKFKDSFLKEKN